MAEFADDLFLNLGFRRLIHPRTDISIGDAFVRMRSGRFVQTRLSTLLDWPGGAGGLRKTTGQLGDKKFITRGNIEGSLGFAVLRDWLAALGAFPWISRAKIAVKAKRRGAISVWLTGITKETIDAGAFIRSVSRRKFHTHNPVLSSGKEIVYAVVGLLKARNAVMSRRTTRRGSAQPAVAAAEAAELKIKLLGQREEQIVSEYKEQDTPIVVGVQLVKVSRPSARNPESAIFAEPDRNPFPMEPGQDQSIDNLLSLSMIRSVSPAEFDQRAQWLQEDIAEIEKAVNDTYGPAMANAGWQQLEGALRDAMVPEASCWTWETALRFAATFQRHSTPKEYFFGAVKWPEDRNLSLTSTSTQVSQFGFDAQRLVDFAHEPRIVSGAAFRFGFDNLSGLAGRGGLGGTR